MCLEGVPRTGRLGRKGVVLRHRVPGGWPSVDQWDAGASISGRGRGVEGADRKSKDSNSSLWSKFYLRRISRLLCGALGGKRGWDGVGWGWQLQYRDTNERSLATLDLS